jgi:hypothetical protein
MSERSVRLGRRVAAIAASAILGLLNAGYAAAEGGHGHGHSHGHGHGGGEGGGHGHGGGGGEGGGHGGGEGGGHGHPSTDPPPEQNVHDDVSQLLDLGGGHND